MSVLTFLGILAAAVVLDARGSGADAAPWCAWYQPMTYDCAYYSQQSCLDTIRGVGGWCARNVYEYATPIPVRPPRHKHARRHD